MQSYFSCFSCCARRPDYLDINNAAEMGNLQHREGAPRPNQLTSTDQITQPTVDMESVRCKLSLGTGTAVGGVGAGIIIVAIGVTGTTLAVGLAACGVLAAVGGGLIAKAVHENNCSMSGICE